jgi:hypothetical protein
MARRLKLHGKVYGRDRQICTLQILDSDDKIVSEALGVKLIDIEGFFKRNRQLMPGTAPIDFTLFLANTGDVCVTITDDISLYGELGLHFAPA